MVFAVLSSVAIEPGAAAGFQNLRDPEYVVRAFLEAETETSKPFVSIDNPNATVVPVFKAPEAGPASGATTSAAWYAGQPGQVLKFPGGQVPRDCYLNLTAPVSGVVYWTNTYLNTLKADSTNVVGSLASLENGRFRVELFVGEVRIGGVDRFYTVPPLAASPALPRAGWESIGVGFRPEISKVSAGEPLSVHVTRLTDNLDFWVGTHGPYQSFLALRCFERDPLDGLLYLERGTLTLLDVDPSRTEDEDPEPVGAALLLLGLPLAAVAGRGRSPTRGILVVALLFAAGMGGCLGGKAAVNRIDTGPSEPTPTDVERGFERNETLAAKGRGALVGAVRNGEKAGLPLVGTSVIVVGTGLFGTTDPLGLYAFDNVTPFEYLVRFDHSGYVSVEERVRVEAGVISYLNVTLFTEASLKKRGFSNAFPHPHDLWSGATRLQLYDGTFTTEYPEELYRPTAPAGRVCNEAEVFLTCGVRVPVDLHRPVLPGTTLVELVANWNADAPGAPKQFALSVQTPVNQFGYNYVARSPGQVFRIAVFPNEADPGHQNFTNWVYTLRPLVSTIYNPSRAVYTLPSMHVTIHISKGVVPLEPTHVDFWGANTTLPIFKDAAKTASGLNDYPLEDVRDQQANARWLVTGKTYIPAGTIELRGRLNWSAPAAGFSPQWGLLYKPANLPNTGWKFGELTKVEFGPRQATGADFVIRPKADELDKFYQPASAWRFYLDDNKAPLDPYSHMQPNDQNSGVKFQLTVTAVRDPKYADG